MNSASTFSGQPLAHRADELAEFLVFLCESEVRRYLEIGVRHGDTFAAVAEKLPRGSLMVAVDLPGAAWGRRGSEKALFRAVQHARQLGHEPHVIWGDSHRAETVAAVRQYAPFDLAFIDGDHSLGAVSADVQHYAPLTECVALHDVAADRASNPRVEVPILWAEITACFEHREVIGAHKGMGIGLYWPGKRLSSGRSP